MLRIIEIESVPAAVKVTRPTPAHIKVVGEYDGSGFSCGFVEFSSTYLYAAGEITSIKELPPVNEMASAVRAYYREVQEKQLAQLAEQNRNDMAAEMKRVGVAAYVPRMNTHGVDSNLTRMEADLHRELSEESTGAGEIEGATEGNGAAQAQWGGGKPAKKGTGKKG